MIKCQKYKGRLFVVNLKKKIQEETLTINLQKLSHLKKKTTGDPYYTLSKFESLEKKQGGTLTINFQNSSHLKKQGETLTINFQSLIHLKKKQGGILTINFQI